MRNGGKLRIESCPEVDGVAYRSGVYKMPMVRMTVKVGRNLECTGLKHGHIEMYGFGQPQLVWLSKNLLYEKPYCVTGTVKPTGS